MHQNFELKKDKQMIINILQKQKEGVRHLPFCGVYTIT